MYFDNPRCPVCRSQFDPDNLRVTEQGMTCPSCGSQLSVKSLFGLRDQFEEEEPEHVTLDDLVPGFGPGSRQPSPEAPPPQAKRPTRAAAGKGRALPDHGGGAAPSPSAKPAADPQPGDGSSVLDALRSLKKR